MYKLIALDIDDTLLDSNKQVSPQNHDAIKRAQAAGVTVALCTGRGYGASLGVAKRIGFDEGIIINYGGVCITKHPSGETTTVCALDNALAHEAVAFTKARGLHVQAYRGDTVLAGALTDELKWYQGRIEIYDYELINMDTDDLSGTPKVLAIGDAEYMPEFVKEARAHFGSRLQMLTSNPRMAEFYHPQSNKGIALEKLAEMLHVGRSEVIAMGDDDIDLSMIQYAGLGVAVSNAKEPIKRAAEFIAPSCDESAVAYVIDRFIFGEVR